MNDTSQHKKMEQNINQFNNNKMNNQSSYNNNNYVNHYVNNNSYAASILSQEDTNGTRNNANFNPHQNHSKFTCNPTEQDQKQTMMYHPSAPMVQQQFNENILPSSSLMDNNSVNVGAGYYNHNNVMLTSSGMGSSMMEQSNNEIEWTKSKMVEIMKKYFNHVEDHVIISALAQTDFKLPEAKKLIVKHYGSPPSLQKPHKNNYDGRNGHHNNLNDYNYSQHQQQYTSNYPSGVYNDQQQGITKGSSSLANDNSGNYNNNNSNNHQYRTNSYQSNNSNGSFNSNYQRGNDLNNNYQTNYENNQKPLVQGSSSNSFGNSYNNNSNHFYASNMSYGENSGYQSTDNIYQNMKNNSINSNLNSQYSEMDYNSLTKTKDIKDNNSNQYLDNKNNSNKNSTKPYSSSKDSEKQEQKDKKEGNEPHNQKSKVASTTTSNNNNITSFNSITEKTKCRDWDKCKKTNDNDHVEKYYHPCRYGEDCKNKDNEIHKNRFQHPCFYGRICGKQFNKEHCKYLYH